jgi:Nucleotidyl transferase AbiEii toxin, Type IV TA system
MTHYFYDAGSGNETKRRVLEVREKAHTFTKETIRPALRAVIAAELGSQEGWTLESEEPRSLRFQYPTTQHGQVGYVKPDVSIEFGHADRWPAFDVDIQPYVVDVLDAVTGRVRVNVLDPQRTFWEKATLLHEIAHRAESIRFPPRHSRHYYDLALLAGSSIGGAAIANTALLSAVAAFKSVFFASGRARYDLAKPGTLRLMFPDFRRDAVAADYEQMQPMLFGSGMTFDDMCHRIIEVETRINGAT